MTMNTRVHINKPIDPEAFFLHILAILERDPNFVPAWEQPSSKDPFKPEPGPLKLTRATYKHVKKGDPWRRSNGEIICKATTGEPFIIEDSGYATTLGQGLGCIWEVEYADDGPLVWPPYEDDEEGEEVARGNTADPLREHIVSCNFDTAYGYDNGHGGHCSDFHAYLLSEIRAYLHEQGCGEWSWCYEEQGTWHSQDETALRGNASLGRLGVG